MANNGRYTQYLLFEAIKQALKAYVAEEEASVSAQKSKANRNHSLALALQKSLEKLLEVADGHLPSDMKVDIMIEGLDILVHDRKGKRLLALLVSHDYLDKKAQEVLHQLNNGGCKLTLGIAFLPQKEYVLLYRPKEESLDYYHYNRSEGTASLLMKKEVEGEGEDLQLSLGIKEKRKRKKPTVTQDR